MASCWQHCIRFEPQTTRSRDKRITVRPTGLFYILGVSAAGTAYSMSSWATSSIEEIAAIAPRAPKFFQVYLYKVKVMLVFNLFWKLGGA